MKSGVISPIRPFYLAPSVTMVTDQNVPSQLLAIENCPHTASVLIYNKSHVY